MAKESMPGPALAMLDIADVPAGLVALDVLAKEAEVRIVSAGTVQSGRFLILFGGDVEPVERSFERASSSAGAALCDAVLLPWAEERIAPAIAKGTRRWPAPGDSLGVLQNSTSPTLLRAVDAALKGALVDLVELRIGDGLHGKAIASVWGETHDVEAAVELADAAAQRGNAAGWSCAVIRRADDMVLRTLGSSTHFFSEWRG
ncbi:MAG: BMC domain-containing protein [Polyangiaceae bacterium]